MKKSIITLLTTTMLFAAPSAQEVANQLKALQGKTLKNPVVFVKYGKGLFDWLAVTTDGKFAAKLNGLNPDGTFNYTILGDPAKHGLKLNVSLTGVEINAISNNSQSLVNLQKKVKVGETAFAAFSWSSSNQISSPVRNIKKFSFLSKLFKSTIHIPKHYTRASYDISSQLCTGGGSAIITGNPPTDYTIIFKNCKTLGEYGNSYTLINGREHVIGISEEEIKETELFNFTLLDYVMTIDRRSAKFIWSVEYMKILDEDGKISSASNVSFIGQVENKEIFKIVFDKYSYKETRNQNQYIFSTKGKIRVDCIKGWTQFSTLSPIQGFLYNDCPNKGLLEVRNDNVVAQVRVNSDTSIDIIDVATNKILKHYENCNKIPDPLYICQNSNQ